MKKGIKVILVTFMLTGAGAAPASDQGTPVIDAAHILESIYNGY